MYERSFPVLRSQVEHSYRNPRGVVHINTGNSGGRNGFEDGPPANFTAMRLTDVPCYTRQVRSDDAHRFRYRPARGSAVGQTGV